MDKLYDPHVDENVAFNKTMNARKFVKRNNMYHLKVITIAKSAVVGGVSKNFLLTRSHALEQAKPVGYFPSRLP